MKRWSATAIGLAAIAAGACVPAQSTTPGGAGPAGAGPRATVPSAAAPEQAPAAGEPAQAAALFPERTLGWAAVDQREMARVEGFAADYAQYSAAAKTPRRAIAGLVELFGAGAHRLEPGARPRRAPGARFWLIADSGDAAAFAVLGTRPLRHGARIVVASVDAPRIDLEPAPVQVAAGVVTLDTVPYGELDLASWLTQPLALYLHAERAGARDGALDIVLGEAEDDPILVIPDLLVHLSRKVQRDGLVDSDERLDPVVASAPAALGAFLARHGTDERVLAEAEASLVPAGPARFIGVDRALLAGYGHSHRAFAYAAVRALADARRGDFAAVVIVTSRAHAGHQGASGPAFIRLALSRLLASLGERGEQLGVADIRRFYALSAALMTNRRLRGTASHGLVLSPRSDDALPAATRRVLDVFDHAGVAYQLSDQPGWGNSRVVSTLDLAAVDVAIAATGHGSPREVISTLDLFHAHRGCAGWFADTAQK